MEEDIKVLEWVVTNKLYIDTHNECDYHNIHKAIENLIKGYKELEKYKRKHSLVKNNYIPKSKVRDLLKELNNEYIKQEEIFNKHFEKENRDMQDYYIQKEATNIMQEISWLEGKIEELLEGDDK